MTRRARSERHTAFEDIVYGLQHDAFSGPVLQSALRAWCLGERDTEIIEMLEAPVRKLRVQEALGVLEPFRMPGLHENELFLGKDAAGRKTGILRQWLNAGALFAGNTGSGKTTLVLFLLLQLAQFLRGIWLSDLYKNDARRLFGPLSALGVKLIIAQSARLKINPLQPDCEPRTHLAMVLDVLRRVLDLPPRAMTILRTVAHAQYEKFGIFRGQRENAPTLFHLFEEVRSSSGLNPAAREAILDRLGSLLLALTPQVGAYLRAWKPSELSKFRIVFEMRGAAESVKSLLLNHLLFSVLYNRVEEGRANAPLDLCVAFEDSQRFFGSSETSTGEITPLTEVAGLIRGMGVSLWGSCQSMAGLSSGLVPNLATRFMGRLGSHQDYVQLGADMGMNPSQIAWAKLHLNPGIFIVQLAEGPWRHPFVIQVPRLPLAPVSQSEVERSLGPLDELQTLPAAEFMRWTPNPEVAVSSIDVPQPQRTSLSEQELRFLKCVVEEPGRPSSTYAKLSAMSARRAIAVRTQLVSRGYIKEVKVATGARGRMAIILLPTDDGKAVIRPFPENEGKAS